MVKKKCAVLNCCSVEPGKVMIRVPKDPVRRSNWFAAIGQPIRKTCNVFVCEDHFILEHDAENWMEHKTMKSLIKIKPSVTPHIFYVNQPTSSSQLTQSAKKRRQENLRRLQERKLQPKALALPTIEISSSTDESTPPEEEHDSMGPSTSKKQKQAAESELSPTGNTEITDGDVMAIDSPGQSNESPLTLTDLPSSCSWLSSDLTEPTLYTDNPLDDFASNQENAHLSTGPDIVHTVDLNTSVEDQDTWNESDDDTVPLSELPSVSSFLSWVPDERVDEDAEQGFKKLCLEVHLKKITRDPRTYLGIPPEALPVVTKLAELAALCERDVLLVLQKIRKNDSFALLGSDFGIHPTWASKIFSRSLPILSPWFANLIYWPSKQSLEHAMPLQFRHRFGNVESIIDCFEVQVEKPSTPKLQALTWSQYKKCNTVKILISCTCNGFVNFISKAYGGRITDNKIVEVSDFVNVVPRGAGILADRGFKQMEGAFNAREITLIRPASVYSNEKPSAHEVMQSRRIAAVRIHIERIIARVRDFKMLGPHANIDIHLIPLMDHIVSVACGIVNLQAPILKVTDLS